MKSIEDIFDGYSMKERPSHPGDYRGRCWHRENHQDGSGRNSMFISTNRNSYHCFSCGASGNLISAMTLHFKVSLSEALDHVTLLQDDDKEIAENKELDLILPTERPEYYLRRGYSKKQLADWKVGKDVDDKGRDLIHVPFYDKGKLIAVQYIHINKDGSKFTWGTEFNKAPYFYGLDKVYPETEELIIVEGHTDVWRVYYWGLPVVGNLGTEFTTNHLDTLKERLPNLKVLHLAYDNDEPGFEAKENAYYMARRHYEILFPIYDGGDPDTSEEENFLNAIDNSEEYWQYQLTMSSVIGEENYDRIQQKCERRARKKGLL